MALIDKASLLMVPSVYEDGTLYNVLPSGNKAPDETGSHNAYDQTRADFTFSRGSNLAATRVNADGLIEKGRENLLLQSNQFDTTWTKSNATLTSGQSGYDGSSNAWKIEATATLANVTQSVSSSGVNTFSVYAKAGTEDGIFLRVDGGSNPRCFYNIKDGVVGNPSGSPVETSMEDLGDGWYRCKLVVNSAITAAKIYVANDSANFPTSGSIYIQNAQLENGLVATDYIETGATTATAGVLENTPRIDYSSGAGALLLESQRTNLITNSEYINTTDWNHQGVTSSVNTSETTSPEGVYNAVKFTATNTDPYIFRSVSVSTGDNTFSFYVKGTGSSVGKTARILFWYIGTATGTQTSHNFTLTDQWQRVDATTSPTGAGTLTFRIDIPADSAVIGDVCYLYGLQIESGSHVSSYVPTYGSAATRGADQGTISGASHAIGQDTGSVFLEYDNLDNDGGNIWFNVAGTSSFNDWIFVGQSGSNSRMYLKANNTILKNYQVAQSNGITKLCITYDESTGAKFFMNGAKVDTYTGAFTFSQSLAKVQMNGGGTPGTGTAGFIEAMVFDEELTEAEAITLTTL